MYCYCIENSEIQKKGPLMKMASTLQFLGLSPGFCTLGIGRYDHFMTDHTQFWLKLTALRDYMVHPAMIFCFCNTNYIVDDFVFLCTHVDVHVIKIMSFILDSTVNARLL